MCAEDGNVEKLTRENIACAAAAADNGSTCAVVPCIRTLCAAQTEFHYGITLCGIADAACLCCDKRLMINKVQQRCFNELCLHYRCNDANERFIRINEGPLFHCIDFTREMQSAEYA